MAPKTIPESRQVGIQEQFGALKIRADYCASEVRKATSQAEPLWSGMRTVGTLEQRSRRRKFNGGPLRKGQGRSMD